MTSQRTTQDPFGGQWTVDKLERLRRYLDAYVKVFKNQEYLTTCYVDAFAGTGLIDAPRGAPGEQARSLMKGSVQVALGTKPPFDQYVFVELVPKKCAELRALRAQHADLESRIDVLPGDANIVLTDWCRQQDWRTKRAVMFLDPCGMQVDWKLIQAIASTQAIDLWLLVPLFVGANRLLTRDAPPPKQWAERLDRFFGDSDWLSEFYKPDPQTALFAEADSRQIKCADFTGLSRYFVSKLRSIFAGVAANPLVLNNSRGSPMFLLCFAVGNKRGAHIALGIAEHILKM